MVDKTPGTLVFRYNAPKSAQVGYTVKVFGIIVAAQPGPDRCYTVVWSDGTMSEQYACMRVK